MKKKKIVVFLSLLIIGSTLLSACYKTTQVDSTQPSSSTDSASVRIAELEAQIVAIMKDQLLYESEKDQKIKELEAEIQKLRDEARDTSSADTSASLPVDEPDFTYVLDGGKAIITSINTDKESVRIPSVIDGYAVYAIGSDACSSKTLKDVVISEGIVKLDWFAFRNCISLSSVSIPDSVQSVGYGAFDNTHDSLTIYCSRDSFAHKYAQSYGLTYDLT